MLTIKTPSGYKSERVYALETLLHDFLGLQWQHEEVIGIDSIQIQLNGQSGEICLPDVFFQQPELQWLTIASLPAQPLTQWESRELAVDIPLVNTIVPVIYGAPQTAVQADEQRIKLPIDIFGSAFFMLTRYEEAIRSERDNHDRFPATASLAYQEGFLDRPIIDEYVEILWAAMHRLWPQLQRKPRTRTLRVTCDVDSPYQFEFSGYAMARGAAADLLKRRSPKQALNNLRTRWRSRQSDFSGDPHLNNIDWMMDVNEQAGNRVAFYFITTNNHALDGCYRMDEPVIRQLLHRIHERGHEIGLHPSYNTYQSAEQTRQEADILRQTLDNERIPYAALGGRQHYLRWQTPQTARNWESAGMSYDSTLAYADIPGFRCGTSREFTMYDVVERRVMKLKQRPLVLMETTVVAAHYQGLGYTNAALKQMLILKERGLSIGGEFTLLWHNSSFEEPAAKRIYKDLIAH